MKKVYLLQHVHEFESGNEDIKTIGVYSSKDNAQNAVNKLSTMPGFKQTSDGFSIDVYEIDKDNWAEGFQTIQNDR